MSASREILIVDDDSSIVRALQRALDRWYVIKTSSSARDALARLERGERFGVILCDLTMREMNGLALHAALRQCCPDQAAAIIFMTGAIETPELDTIPNIKLVKPLRIAALRTIIDTQLTYQTD